MQDVQTLVDKMDYLINHQEVSRDMGNESSKIAKEKYDVKIVNQTILKTMELF